jgi:hypothetical protein
MPLFKRIGRALSARLTRVTVDPQACSDLAGAFIASVEKLYARMHTCLDDAISGER